MNSTLVNLRMIRSLPAAYTASNCRSRRHAAESVPLAPKIALCTARSQASETEADTRYVCVPDTVDPRGPTAHLDSTILGVGEVVGLGLVVPSRSRSRPADG